MKKYIILLFVLIGSIIAHAQDERFTNANELYKASKFAESIVVYESILQTGMESEALYFNLGNAYYKTGQLPKAILNYERAKLLDSDDADIAYNLELANSQIADRINGLGEFFIKTWAKKLIGIASSDSWTWIGILLLVIGLVAAGFFMYTQSANIKRISFFAAIVMGVLTIVSFSFAYSQKQGLTNRNSAIVFATTLNVKSSPDASGTNLFVIHEGIKVIIIEKLGNWLKVKLIDGSEGWIPNESIEII